MKTLGKVLGVILVCLALLLIAARINGFEPNARRAGLWLTGQLVTTPVTDWSFANHPRDCPGQRASSRISTNAARSTQAASWVACEHGC